MEAGARVDVAPYKRSPLDFVLWKPSKPGEPSWPSPAGIAAPGRPGWHIECSAMSWKHLGEAFDIHGGGIDLVFPHHENEVAQSRCALGTPAMANVWMHNGFLQVEGEKMSKCLGNFVTINELLATDVFGGRSWPGEVLRLAMLQTHYRQPIDWTVRALEESRGNMHAWRSALLNSHMSFIEQNRDLYESLNAHPDVLGALQDDLNTPEAITAVHRLKGDIADVEALFGSLKFLGLISFDDVARQQGVEGFAHKNVAISLSLLEDMIAARTSARIAKNWKESDRIRNKLQELGIVLKDNKDGTTTWEVAR